MIVMIDADLILMPVQHQSDHDKICELDCLNPDEIASIFLSELLKSPHR